ncbi:hypothetical protein [Mucilaginibacter jinjuensis]|uniref:Uncharacterized protein n=1 Tax=Mucilaginibacter jinjuensis TaxID=1176721 RepID=A0ABY7TDZ4_9SPHI|nr:hypothetical protein [Mucilaginibacter jinjuensis]WCT14464.1 hypothetical protein PQO05_11020 [Mucilaginibacter jinjuensis]
MSFPDFLNNDRFSKYAEIIKMRYLADEDFRMLCDDYAISKIKIEKYEGRLMEDSSIKQEYEHLASELENDILRYLNKLTDKRI